MKNKSIASAILIAFTIVTALTSCNNSKSYAELLNDERHATNVFLANHRVIDHMPADNVFETGEDAPFYKMDEEGNVYMQVIRYTKYEDDKAKINEPIYFRYMRYDLLSWYQTGEWEGSGNANEMSLASTYFIFGNFTMATSSQYGYGIQLPLSYLGVDSEVNLVIKSQYGYTSEISYVRPFYYHIRYFRSMI